MSSSSWNHSMVGRGLPEAIHSNLVPVELEKLTSLAGWTVHCGAEPLSGVKAPEEDPPTTSDPNWWWPTPSTSIMLDKSVSPPTFPAKKKKEFEWPQYENTVKRCKSGSRFHLTTNCFSIHLVLNLGQNYVLAIIDLWRLLH